MSAATSKEKERRNDWLRFIKNSQPTYRLNALKAVLENDGAAMLNECLRELGWTQSKDLIANCESPSPWDAK